ncbi:MAG: hypothetical protein IJU95_09675 [Treponema sp.]|nr:hypothetical protein [Treponema sp.]
MSRYAYIHTQIWKDRKFRQLSESSKLLYIAMLTAPNSNMLGFYEWPVAYALHDLGGWQEDKFSSCLQEIEAQGMACYDTEYEVLFIRNFLKHNPLSSIKQVVGGAKYFSTLPPSPLFLDFAISWREFVEAPFRKNMEGRDDDYSRKSLRDVDKIAHNLEELLKKIGPQYTSNSLSVGRDAVMEEPEKGYQVLPDPLSIREKTTETGYPNPLDTLPTEWKATPGSPEDDYHYPTDTLPNGFPNHTDNPVPVPGQVHGQGQVHVQVHGTVQKKKDEEEAEAEKPATLGRVIKLWNDTLSPLGFSQVMKVTPGREKAFKARVNTSSERKALDWWQDSINRLALSNFMRDSAKNKANWLTFDWFLSENNLVKVIEGKYDNDKTQPGNSPRQIRGDEIPTSYDEAVAKYLGGDRRDEGFIDVEANEVGDRAQTGLPGIL